MQVCFPLSLSFCISLARLLFIHSKKHLEPLGTDSSKRKIHEPLLLQCRNIVLPKKWWRIINPSSDDSSEQIAAAGPAALIRFSSFLVGSSHWLHLICLSGKRDPLSFCHRRSFHLLREPIPVATALQGEGKMLCISSLPVQAQQEVRFILRASHSALSNVITRC